MNDGSLTLKQAAKILGVAEATLKDSKWRSFRRIPTHKKFGRLWWDEGELREYLRREERVTVAEHPVRA